MTFKREGNDADMLKALDHRRVADLLSENIPEDEAILLSNGRFSCAICLSRPVFDTIPVLSIHRKGKKHLQELTKYLEHKKRLELRNKKSTQQAKPEITANSYVRKYLKKLPRKNPFERKVEVMRDSYGATSSSTGPLLNKLTVKPAHKQVAYTLKKSAARKMHLLESGWLQGKDGSWSKDPEVEFDSDEETPPNEF